MKSGTGLGTAGIVATKARSGATPVASIVAYPAPQPPPGRPIDPAMAASTTDIQIGCSPWSARCTA
jgi:hypothetical protein